MNINQLRYFVTVAQLENVSKAAELLFLNQPSLSKSIKGIEAEIGTTLFTRNGKRITLNPQGRRFLEFANTVLLEYEQAKSDIGMLKGTAENRLRIGIAGFSSSMIDLAAEFKKTHPDICFDFDFNIESTEELDINDYDALVYPDVIRYEKYNGFLLGEERYLLAVSRSHPLASMPFASSQHLKDLDYVFMHRSRYFQEYPYHVCLALNIPFRSVCYTDSMQSHIRIIASGIACGFVAEGMRGNYEDRDIRLVPLGNKKFARKMKICFKRDKHLSPLGKDFREASLAWFGISPSSPEAGK